MTEPTHVAAGPFTIPYAIGCDIGVTHVKLACVSREGTVLHRDTTETRADSPDWPARVARHLRAVESSRGAADAVGVAAPGIASAAQDRIVWMQGRLDAIEGLNWATHLGRDPVPVLNDAQAALLGEAWIGAARGSRNVAMLTLGTGVGGALMVDGRLLRGALGRAGHLGHISLDADGEPDITGTPGSLEHAIGNCTVSARTGGQFSSTHELIAAANAGDDEAKMHWLGSVRALAVGVASIVNVADPETFVVGGGIARAGDALFEPLKGYLDRFEWRPHGARVRVVPAELGEYAGAIGAAREAFRHADDTEDFG